MLSAGRDVGIGVHIVGVREHAQHPPERAEHDGVKRHGGAECGEGYPVFQRCRFGRWCAEQGVAQFSQPPAVIGGLVEVERLDLPGDEVVQGLGQPDLILAMLVEQSYEIGRALQGER